MKIEYIKDPIYCADGARIDCRLKWDEIDEELPFTADPNDVEEHGRAIHAALVAGEFGPVAAYQVPET